ncbi:MAG: hypothetical protein GY845_04430, partial [Planctomycetes bacterium]|nr:hypothetical protein [Planctomycetota bacterium]
CNDNCPTDPNKTVPGICGCGTADTDTDNDGTADCNDNCPADPNKTEPGICGCGTADTDSDNDGTADCNDNCPNDPNKTEPGICGCGTADTDTDNDGTADCNDICPTDPNKTEPGICGCGDYDVDTDGDGTADCNDICSTDPNKTEPGICGCGVDDTDSDNDGTADCIDNCPADPNKTEPGICGCGTADIDSDNDGTADCDDNCPDDPNKTEPGNCGCGVDDTDTDGDGVSDCIDNCPEAVNADQLDTDGDGVGDACEIRPTAVFTKTRRVGFWWWSHMVTEPVPNQEVIAYEKSCAEGALSAAGISEDWSEFTEEAYTSKSDGIDQIVAICGDPAGTCITDSDGSCNLILDEGAEYVTFSQFLSWSCEAKNANRPDDYYSWSWLARRLWDLSLCHDTGALSYAIQRNPVDSSDDVVDFAVFEASWGDIHPTTNLGTILGSVLDVSATEYIVKVPEGESFDEELDPNNEVELVYPVILYSDSDWEVAINATPPEGYEIVTPYEPILVSEDEPKVVVIGYKPITQ